jgi:iron(III) transport system substrate-binding protein
VNRTTTRHLIAALTVVLLPASKSCGADDGRRSLVVYSAHAVDILGEFERAFEAAHPDVDVRTAYLGSNEILERLRAERARPQCDVWLGGDATALAVAAEEGLLAPYEPTYDADDAPRDPEWRWTACFELPMVLGFHPERIASGDLPKTFAALGDPKFKGVIVLREPAASGTMRMLFCALIAREIAAGKTEDQAFEVLDRLHANVRDYEGKPELLFEALEKGPASITTWNLTDLLFQRRKNGYSFLPAPLDEPVPTVVDGVALCARAAASDDAKAFYEFVNTEASLRALAERHCRIPARKSFPKDGLVPELRDFPWTALSVDAGVLRRETSRWMTRFEERIRAAKKNG